MKMICNGCKKLEKEEEIIKLSMAEFNSLIAGYGPYSISSGDYHIYTQICQDCYRKFRSEEYRESKFDPEF